MKVMLDKNKFKQFSYSSSKWVIKHQRQLTTSTMHLAQELLMNVQCSSGSRSFAKKIRSMKLRSAETSHRKLTTTIWEDHWSWSLKTTQEVAQKLNVNYSTVVWHLKQILKVKKLDTWVPHELPQIKNIVVLKCRFSSSRQQQQNISQLACDMQWKVDFIWQPGMTSSVVGLRRHSKAPPKAKPAP